MTLKHKLSGPQPIILSILRLYVSQEHIHLDAEFTCWY